MRLRKRMKKIASNDRIVVFAIYKEGKLDSEIYILTGEDGAEDVCYYTSNKSIYPSDTKMNWLIEEMYEKEEVGDKENRIEQSTCNEEDFKNKFGQETLNKMIETAEETREI